MARDGKIRDYSLIKKISKLNTNKRNQAIDLIEKGEFNAKEFFERKRYDKKEVSEQDSSAKAVSSFMLKLEQDQWVKLIKKTGYDSMLSRSDETWEQADSDQFKSFIKSFKQWCVEAE